ncbi:hypothetical protein F5X96DRAFT_689748 [Biscogniauxia mediterranea]|nr:hypothetical protein F5X96DRAFT_689748 [Biscogniauxia mediterranea]
MPNLSYLQARIDAAGSTSPPPAGGVTPAAAPSLSLGAIIGIAVGGSVILFAALTPVLILLAKWQDRRRADASAIVAACCPISSSTFAAIATRNGHHLEDDRTAVKEGVPRRLRKKSVASEQILFDAAMGTASGEGGGIRRGSVPVLPPVVSRPGSFNFIDPFAVARPQDESDDGSGIMVKKQRSPDKQRGYMIYQNRRKTSWIDEDALHGPRISSPKKGGVAKRNPSWVANFGRGLGRSLSRRFSVRRGVAGASQLVGRSPTLPYTETARGSGSISPTKTTHTDEKIPVREDTESARDIEAGIAAVPVPRQENHHYQPHGENRGAPPQAYAARREGPRPASNTPIINNNNQNDNNVGNHRHTVAFNAAEQLAGGARLPVPMSMSMPATPAVGRRPGHRRMTQSNTDAELQAILRRTAERLQDGRQSARRQTMMSPGSAPSASSSTLRKTPDDRTGAPNTPTRGTGGRYEPTTSRSGNISPTRSQKSAPAVLAACNEVRAELDGSSSLQVPAPAHGLQPQGQTQSQTSRRHTRQPSQISQASVVSEADSLVVSRRGSQQDMVQTPLSSPSRAAGAAARTSPANNNPQMQAQIRQLPAVPPFPRPFSMASTESSALSTVYSEEETSIVYRSPPADGNGRTSNRNSAANPATHMERQAMQQALAACDAFVKRSSQMSLDGVGGLKSPPDHGASPEPLRVRKETTGQTAGSKPALPSSQGTGSNTAAATSQAQHSPNRGLKVATPKEGPPSFTIHALDDVDNDPFTATTPSPTTRLSKLFSPLPAKRSSAPSSPTSPKSASSSRTARQAARQDRTPTRTPSSRKRVVPPPHVLRAGAAGDAPPVGVATSVYSGVEENSPAREPSSPAPSEGGLSSVYESYAYRDSSYSAYGGNNGGAGASEEMETATVTTARNSVVTLVTAPTTAATSPTRGNSSSSCESPSGRASRAGFRARDIIAPAQPPSGTTSMPITAEEEQPKSQQISITVKSPTPSPAQPQQHSHHHHHHHRGHHHYRRRTTTHARTSSSSTHRSTGSTESSRYSQDDDDDHHNNDNTNNLEAANSVPPLHLPYGTLTHHHSSSFSSSSRRPSTHHHRAGAQHSVNIVNYHPSNNNKHHPARVASAVAELRRMNSTVSCASSSTTTTTTTATATATADLAAFKRAHDNRNSEKKNNNSPTLPDLRGGGFGPSGNTRAGRRNYLALGSMALALTPPSPVPAVAAPAIPPRGGVRNSVIGGNSSNNSSSLRTHHANKLLAQRRSEPSPSPVRGAKRASIESLGLYDEDGFLKNSPERPGGFLSVAAAAAAAAAARQV